jgi:hypothetical protein
MNNARLVSEEDSRGLQFFWSSYFRSRANGLESSRRQLMPVAGGYVVLPSLASEQPQRGIVSVKGLSALLSGAAANRRSPTPAPRCPQRRQRRRDLVGKT